MRVEDFSKNWIEQQVCFWYGRFSQTLESDWLEMGKTITINKALTIEDTIATMKLKDYPDWTEEKYIGRYELHLDKVKFWHSIKDFTKEHVFPFKFNDNAGRERVTISHSRPFNDGYGLICIVNNMWDRHKHGSDDSLTFEDKINKIQFLGSFTGPFKSSVSKTSRVEIVSKWFNGGDWIDVGFVLKPQNIVLRTEYEESLKLLIKPEIPLKENMKYRYILCLEGNDVSSSFSWALASNCVPIHTYPFSSVAHFMNGLQPYIHFIPIKRDASDLFEVWQWCQNNEEKCKQIAERGKEHMKPMQDKELCMKVEAEFVRRWDLQIKHLKKARC